jgi:hypothetical protein
MTDPIDSDTGGQVMEDDLARIREWAQDRLDAHQPIPWDSRRYQHLVALIDDLLAAKAGVAGRGELLQTQFLACAGRRTGNIVYLDAARRARPAGVRISG